MSENRLPDYLEHMRQAASDARTFVDGLTKSEFLADKRTQQAVIMSLIIVGEAATKAMDRHPEFADRHPEVNLFRIHNNHRGRRSLGADTLPGYYPALSETCLLPRTMASERFSPSPSRRVPIHECRVPATPQHAMKEPYAFRRSQLHETARIPRRTYQIAGPSVTGGPQVLRLKVAHMKSRSLPADPSGVWNPVLIRNEWTGAVQRESLLGLR
jgi:hypothetical protein